MTVRDSANTRNETAGRSGTGSHHSGTTLSDVSYADRWGEYTEAIELQERLTGPAPEPTMPGRNGPVLSHRFAEWMMGFPPGWVADVDIPKPTKRQPERTLPMPRTVAIRLLGNAVVTDQASAALKILLNRMQESAR